MVVMLQAALKLARLRIIVTCLALVTLGSAAAGAVTPKTLLAWALVALWTVHANGVNDIADLPIDRINLPGASDRPLVTGDISVPGMWLVINLAGATALSLSLLFGLPGIVLTVAVLAVDYAYSLKPIRITDRPLASPFTLAAAYVAGSMGLGFVAAGRGGSFPWLLALGIFLGFTGRMLLKDFRDTAGDLRYGKRTFLLKYGALATCAASAVLWVSAMIVVAASVGFAPGVLVPLLFGTVQVLLMLLALSRESHRGRQLTLVGVIAKAANFAVLTVLVWLLCNAANLPPAAAQLVPATLGTALLMGNLLQHRRRFITISSQLTRRA